MPEKKKGADPLSILDAAPKKKKKSKKSDHPEITVDGIDTELDDFLKAKKAEKEEGTKKEKNEAVVLKAVLPVQAEHFRNTKEHSSAVHVNGKVMVVTQNRYSKIPVDDAEVLEDTFGKDDMDKYFVRKRAISFSKAVLQNDEKLGEIIAALQQVMEPEEFHENFDIENYIEPTEIFHKDRYLDPEVAAKADELIEAGIIKPTKPSVKEL